MRRCFSLSFWACSNRSQKLNEIFFLKTFPTHFKMSDVLIPRSNISPLKYFHFNMQIPQGNERWRSKLPESFNRPPLVCTLPCCRHLRDLHEQCNETKKAGPVHAFPVQRTCKLTELNFYFKCIILHVYFHEIMTVDNSSVSCIVCIVSFKWRNAFANDFKFYNIICDLRIFTFIPR